MPRARLFGRFCAESGLCAYLNGFIICRLICWDPFMTRSHHQPRLHSNFRCLQTLFPFRGFPRSSKTRSLQTFLSAGVCLFHVKMESLSDTLWDVVISGTGLQQSLLAL